MTDIDERLREALRTAQADSESGRAPDFADCWSAAERRAGVLRRRRGVLAGSAVAAAAVLAIGLLGGDDREYIDSDEFLGSTSWSAPSDSLLPERRFDIYSEIPLQMESTGTNGGALL